MRFSVDMIRLSVRVLQSDLLFLQSACDSGLITYYNSFDFKAFRDNFKIEESVFYDKSNNVFCDKITDTGCVNRVWLGCNHNSKVCEDRLKTTLYIEFNPNKTDLYFGVTKQVFNRYFRGADFTIVSCDIAIDFFDCSLDDLFFDKKRFRRVLDYREGAGRTLYFGTKKTSGYTKVYDKAAEQKKDCVWSRVEYSFRIDKSVLPVVGGVYDFDCSIPELTFYNFTSLPSEVDIKDRCCLKAIFDGYAVITDFGRRYRDKLQDILDKQCTYHLTKDVVYPDCKKTLSDYCKTLVSLLGGGV